MTTVNIDKELITQQDIAFGEGTVSQTRGGVNYNLDLVRAIYPVNSLLELAAIDTTKFKKAALVVDGKFTFYYFDGTWKTDVQPSKTVNLFADLATLAVTVGEIVATKGTTILGQKAAQYIARSGSVLTEFPSRINSTTPNVYFDKVGEVLDYSAGMTLPQLSRSLTANEVGQNFDKQIMLFGDSHGWGQGSPEYDIVTGGNFSAHSASLFNKGFFARIEEYINEKRGFLPKVFSTGIGNTGIRILPSDANENTADYLVDPIKVLNGKVTSIQQAYTSGGSPTSWYTPQAIGAAADVTTLYRDKLYRGRFGSNCFRMWPGTVTNFMDQDQSEYITLIPLPNVAASGGTFTDVSKDANNVTIAEGDPAGNFFVRISDKIPAADLLMFTTFPQTLFVPGYGECIAVSSTNIGAGSDTGRAIRITTVGGTYPTNLSKYLHHGVKIYRSVVNATTVKASPKQAFRKIYVSVFANTAGRKIQLYLPGNASLNGVQWSANSRFGPTNLPTSSMIPHWNLAKPGFPTLNVIASNNSRIASPNITTSAALGGTVVTIDTYAGANVDHIYEIDFGAKILADVFIQDGGASAAGTNLHSTLRGILFDNNSVTNYSMGGHTMGNWMGDGASYNDPAKDHLLDILSFSKANAYLVLVEFPLVNEYLAQTPIATVKSNIQTFISRINQIYNATHPTRTVQFAFFTTIGHKSLEFEGGSSSPITYQALSDAVREECANSAVMFIDTRQYLKEQNRTGLFDYRLLYHDQIHPSALANELVYNFLLTKIDAML